MPTKGSVLVVLDGSPAAKAAADLGVHIAMCRDQWVRGLYVVDAVLAVDPYAHRAVELREAAGRATAGPDIIEECRRYGECTLAWLEELCQAAGVPVTSEIILGDVGESVLREVGQAALVALGRRGNSHERDLDHLGHHFRVIAHRLRCPLIAGGGPPRRLRCLLLAYNGGPRARAALDWTIQLEASLAVRVAVLTVREAEGNSADEWLEQVRGRVNTHRLPHYTFLGAEGDPVAAITAAAADTEADCIVLGGYQHTAAVEWLVGSTVDAVLRRVQLPAVVV